MNDLGKEIRITSADNPYNPFTHWEQWLLFDINAGYNTCGRLARVTFLSDSMTDKEIIENVELGINELIKTGSINKNGEIIEYLKVFRDKKVLT
jgi:hypothetical protein